ncbi:hypothetical protein FNV43_RR03543 [Rhamnella rubrinervis]|uniref:glucomannan 4-beta-mannosyltransferase n=1 Tax=Rhamnella rubrinervis TaxID=2594499 RepID=A0A8K0MP68_9ROSA|nr:hypothetical protein FNV43_RR03543 [Rhamnella rubrinervis]
MAEESSSKNFITENFIGGYGYEEITGQIWKMWGIIKAPVVVAVLKVMVYVASTMCFILSIDLLYMGLGIILVKLFWKKPEKRYKFQAIQQDPEMGSSNFPLVLVQIPMCNEEQVYKISIGAACGLSWPSDRLVIQVLDDSTDPSIKQMIELECERWASKGIDIRYQTRENRTGYKAGALKEGLKHNYVKHCKYVAIFDADYQPEPDFLRRAIPFLVHNSELALVQARWRYVNADECLLTRMQEMSLDYHFTVEQEVGSATHAFFGFNGTAGVWRIAAINEAGGWKDRTTVEDMDLAVRASLRGWKFVYLGDLQVKSELPSTFKAFRFQQHRWSCGPANLFRKMVMEIIKNKKVTFWKKVYVIYSFFFVRKVIAHMVTFSSTVLYFRSPYWFLKFMSQFGEPFIFLPLSPFSIQLELQGLSIHLLFYWILFENVMSLHRTKATLIGLLEAGRVNEWVVTEKLGDVLKKKAAEAAKNKTSTKSIFRLPRLKIGDSPDMRFLLPFASMLLNIDRLHLLELGFGVFLFFCGCYDFVHGKNNYFIYLFLQTFTFLIAGFGYVGTIIPSS